MKHIQDDMLLMIKNAHYFNETASEIYKVHTLQWQCSKSQQVW